MHDNDQYMRYLIESGRKKGYTDYWERFGYEIGGPVCYGFTRWFSDEIRSKTEITDVIFVARDGWLLKSAFELLNPCSVENPHYVYASRKIAKNCEESNESKEEYKGYLNRIKLGGGTVAVVDTATVGFSSIRLLGSCLKQSVYGYFWTAAGGTEKSRSFDYSVYQNKNKRVLRCWDLIEFILSSPEPPIIAVKDGGPVYLEADEYEKERKELFLSIEKGVLRFLNDVIETSEMPVFDCNFVTKWVNAFLTNPIEEDIEAFSKVKVSSKVDHSGSVLMDPFAKKKFSLRSLKNPIWLFATGHPVLYKVLHGGNKLRMILLDFVKKRG